MTTCGEHGGRKKTGAPCAREAGWGTDHRGSGRCCDHDRFSAEQRAFLAAFRIHANVSWAARDVGIERQRVYEWRKTPAFEEAFQAAKEEAADLLEETAHNLAHGHYRQYQFGRDGKPLIHPETGRPYYEVIRDTGMIKFLHKCLRPEAHRDQLDIRALGLDLEDLPDEVLERLQAGEGLMAIVAELLRRPKGAEA